ncbi:NAD-dependent epimerase/dehydratase family protein [Nitrosopumilus sp. b3]|uniref:NAD-dependent epimerase/dehydratase family protein n=1 Tax=Nitrosopumilus sp. b3 TaxID=2109909 RepID=UPI00210814BC|nr:NAD-dependent epimerase/dehydratase family protein [Nitrosopumilus sp. b3]
MKILVTGGAGFIGKHLVKSLLEKDQLVTIFDNFSNSTKDSVSHLIDIGAKVIEGDITKPLDILNAVKDQEIVIHLAAKISVSESINNPTETFRVNVDGTNNVLIACEKNNVKKLIVSSSAAVYGDSIQGVKLTEESSMNPISPYGESKVKMEQKIKGFVSKHSIHCIILRFFNIYGIGQSSEYAGVITKFIEKIKENKPLEIFGNGLQTRDFVAICDVVNAINSTLLYNKSGTFNIASGKTITVKDLAEQMILWSGKKLGIQYLPEKNEDIKYSQADITMAKNHLTYSPKFELKEGVQELINNYQHSEK